MRTCPDERHIRIPEGICDVHVHFGRCGITGLRTSIGQLVELAKTHRMGAMNTFSFDIAPLVNSRRLDSYTQDNGFLFFMVRGSTRDLTIHEDTLRNLLCQKRCLGMKIHPSLDRRPITDIIYQKWLAFLTEEQKTLLLHCGRWREIAGFEHGVAIANQHPDLRIIFAHMGGNEYELERRAVAAAKKLENVMLDTSNCKHIFMLEHAVQELGSHRILFGSDYPWGGFAQNAVLLLESNLSKYDQDRIFRRNFEDLFNVKARLNLQ